MGWVFGEAQGVWSGPILLSGWLSSSRIATPHRFIQIYNKSLFNNYIYKNNFEVFKRVIDKLRFLI